MSQRPPIPEPIKREVRKRCGFGCVICGYPLYAYDHIPGYANVERHVASELTLLCDQNHREKTNGLLPNEAVIEANLSPFNLREGVSKPYDLHYSGNSCEAVIGGSSFSAIDHGSGATLLAVGVDGTPLLGFVLLDGHLLLILNIFDIYNNLVLKIFRNELIYSVGSWDVELVGRNLIVREAPKRILLDITSDVPNRISITRGRLLCNGVELIIRKDCVEIPNNSCTYGASSADCPAGIVIGRFPGVNQGCLKIDGVPRYPADRLNLPDE